MFETPWHYNRSVLRSDCKQRRVRTTHLLAWGVHLLTPNSATIRSNFFDVCSEFPATSSNLASKNDASSSVSSSSLEQQASSSRAAMNCSALWRSDQCPLSVSTDRCAHPTRSAATSMSLLCTDGSTILVEVAPYTLHFSPAFSVPQGPYLYVIPCVRLDRSRKVLSRSGVKPSS